MFAITPVFMAPSSALAAKRMIQNGKTAARMIKYVSRSFMLNHIPYSCIVIERVIIIWKSRPVATLSILAANMTKPE